MDTSQIVTGLAATLVILGSATFFVISEFALVQTRPSQLEDIITNKEGSLKKLKRALHMVHGLNEYLSTTQVGTTLVGVVLGWFSTDTLSELIIRRLKFSPPGESLAKSVGAVLGILLLACLEIVFTEIAPENIAIGMPVKMSMVIVTPLKCFHILVYPFAWILNTSSSGVLRLMGFKETAEESEIYSQPEIIKLSRLVVTSGALDRGDLKHMERAFELNDKVAKDIMADRTRLTVLDATNAIRTALKLYLDKDFSRFPVVRDNDRDNVVGYVYAYNIVKQGNEDNNASLSRLIRAIIAIPESMPIQDILQLMVQKHTPIVLVVDEYGGISGIATDKDIYEELFGSIRDEINDVSDEYIIRDKDGRVRVSGETTLYNFERFYHGKLRASQDSSIITIGGYMVEHYSDSKKGDSVTVEGYKFEVAEIEQGFMRWFSVEKLNNNSRTTE